MSDVANHRSEYLFADCFSKQISESYISSGYGSVGTETSVLVLPVDMLSVSRCQFDSFIEIDVSRMSHLKYWNIKNIPRWLSPRTSHVNGWLLSLVGWVQVYFWLEGWLTLSFLILSEKWRPRLQDEIYYTGRCKAYTFLINIIHLEAWTPDLFLSSSFLVLSGRV